MSRTTIDLKDGVLRALRARRGRDHKPLGVIESELLSEGLADETTLDEPFEWTRRDMGARFDLEDRDSVWAALGRD